MSIAENVKRLRMERELSQPGLAKLAGVSQQLISQIENGKNLTTKHLPKLARGLNVSITEIAPEFGDLDESNDDTVEVPLLAKISAGRFRAQDGVRPADIERHIKVSHLPKGDWFALTVEGDSMNRIAPDGSIIIVNRADDTLLDGKNYVFSLDNGDATFKKYRRDPEPVVMPYSWNPDHVATAVGDKDLYVFGRVYRVIIDL